MTSQQAPPPAGSAPGVAGTRRRSSVLFWTRSGADGEGEGRSQWAEPSASDRSEGRDLRRRRGKRVWWWRGRGRETGATSRRWHVRRHAMAGTAKPRELLKARRDAGKAGALGRLLSTSATKVLLHKIEFQPASHGFSGQPELLRAKYLLLNPRTEPAEHPRGAEEGQPGKQGGCRGPGGSPCAAQPAAHPPLSPRRQRPDPGAPRGRRPCAPEGAVPCRAPRHAVAACPAHRRRAAQPGKHLFPQRHPAVPHVHATARQLPAVQGAQPHL